MAGLRSLACIALLTPLAVAAAAVAPQPLQYEGISAATTLADLKARFPDLVDTVSSDAANPKHPVSASLRFEPPLGRATYLDYYEIAGETRVIRLFFSIAMPHPQNDRDLSCSILRRELRARFGKEQKVDEFDEEALHHVKYIWPRGNQSMWLDCAHLPSEPLTVDRLYFECKGTCQPAKTE